MKILIIYGESKKLVLDRVVYTLKQNNHDVFYIPKEEMDLDKNSITQICEKLFEYIHNIDCILVLQNNSSDKIEELVIEQLKYISKFSNVLTVAYPGYIRHTRDNSYENVFDIYLEGNIKKLSEEFLDKQLKKEVKWDNITSLNKTDVDDISEDLVEIDKERDKTFKNSVELSKRDEKQRYTDFYKLCWKIGGVFGISALIIMGMHFISPFISNDKTLIENHSITIEEYSELDSYEILEKNIPEGFERNWIPFKVESKFTYTDSYIEYYFLIQNSAYEGEYFELKVNKSIYDRYEKGDYIAVDCCVKDTMVYFVKDKGV